MRKPTIHLITEYQKKGRTETYWKECFKDIDFQNYDVNIIDGTNTYHDSFLFSDTHYKATQLKLIMDLIIKNGVKRGDVFIFVNAWNFIAAPLSYFKDEFGMDFKMIGFWGNALFNQDSPMWQRFKKRYKNWGREFEKALFDAYDLNCFLCQEHFTLFKRKYGRLKSDYAITGFPFEYLTRKIQILPKEDIIVFPYEINYNEIQANIFRGLRSDLPEFQFIFARENHNSRVHYLELLSKSKILFSAQKFEYDPVILWEGMLYGVFPIVPDRKMYHYFFPKNYQYPPELTFPKNNKFLYVLRNRMQLQDFIKETFDSYNDRKDQILIDAREMGEKYYSNKPFLEKLKEI